MAKTVIIDGARTAFGKFGGGLSSLTASDLGAAAIKEAMNRAKVQPEDVQEVIMGNVLQAGQGQIPSRQAAYKAGIPYNVKSETINKVCASGLRAVTMADQIIRLGDEDLIVAGGMESMSNAPYYLPKARWGLRMGDAQRKGDPIRVDQDEAPREGTTAEGLAKLRPAFGKDGTITAGNAPGINDGAAALILMSEERAQKDGKTPLAYVLSHTEVAVEPHRFPETPGLVINELLKKTGKSLEEIDLFEINEAFAAVALASSKIAGLDAEKVNVNGGSVALGHPIGASGARIILTLAYELKRRGGGIGIAAICSGGGQGDAIMIEVPKEAK